MERRKKRIAWAVGGAAVAGLLLLAFDVRLAVRTYAVETAKISAPVRLAALTDLHSCRYGEEQRELLDMVAALSPQPDVVLLVGDIVDDKLPEDNAWTAIEALSAAYPCFYVTGNHEWRGGEAERICADMEARGVAVLRGDAVDLTTAGGQTIQVCGIDDPEAGMEDQLSQAGSQVDEERFSVLLAHRPERVGEYLEYPFDLVVSGHAHGGQ